MKQIAEGLMGPEEKRSDYESQPDIDSIDRTEDEAYGASQHDKDMFIRYLVEQLIIAQTSAAAAVENVDASAF